MPTICKAIGVKALDPKLLAAAEKVQFENFQQRQKTSRMVGGVPPLKWSTIWDSLSRCQEYPVRAEKRDQPEEIVLKLRQVEVLQGQGRSIVDPVRQIGGTQQTYSRWRKQYGGMNRDQLKRLKQLETESLRLRRAVPDLTLDKMIPTEVA